MVDMEPKIKTLVWLGTAIAPLSIVGSCLTLTTIYRTATSTRRIRRRASSMSTLGSNNSPTPTPTPSSRAVQRQQQQAQQNSKITTYHHLMVCISIFDIILSTAIFFGPLPIPVETGFPYARGTQGTCTCQGFMMQLGTASFGLNGMLMIYFVSEQKQSTEGHNRFPLPRVTCYIAARTPLPALIHSSLSLRAIKRPLSLYI